MNRKEAHEHLIAMYESYLEKVPMLIAEKAFDYFENLLERDTHMGDGFNSVQERLNHLLKLAEAENEKG